MRDALAPGVIGYMTRIALSIALLAGAAGSASAQSSDTTALFARARAAELEAEEAITKYAEFKPGPPYSLQECDERIGGTCIYYEPAGQQRPKEPAKVSAARARAIDILRTAFAAAAGRSETVFPLVRLLVKDGRPDEAVQIATGFLAANESAEGHMVLGYALHHARRTEAALEELNKWGAASPASLREQVDNIAWLVPPGMAPKYLMTVPRLWRYADALYLTPGNETLAEHYARHAYAQMMAVRPIPSNGTRWSADDEQTLVRFGPDVVVTRHFFGRQMSVTQSFLEHWDNTAHTYFPPDYDRVVQMRAPVDTLWPTDTLVGRSGHAPPTIRFMRSLQKTPNIVRAFFRHPSTRYAAE